MMHFKIIKYMMANTNAISLQIGQMFTKAMVVYGLSTIFFSTIDAICDNFDLWFF